MEESPIITYKIKRFDTCKVFTVDILLADIEYLGLGQWLVDNGYFDSLGHDSDYFEILERSLVQN